MRLKEIEERLKAIKSEMDLDGADIKALTDEVDSLLEERKQLMESAETRTNLLNKIAEGEIGTMPTTVTAPVKETRTYNAMSAEYRTAFLKNLAGIDQNEWTKEERLAYVATTGLPNSPADVIPTTMLNEIWDLVSGEHSIMGDITIYRTGTVIEIVRHTEVTQGKAKKVNENAANDDEQNVFVKITLSGNDFSKHVDLSYAMARMSIDALESYLIREIATSIGEALADDVVATVVAGTNAGNKVTTTAVKTLTYAEVAKAFGTIKRASALKIYASRATIYNYLVSMVDSTGRPIFQPNAQAGAEGTLLGASIKIEDSVADGVLLIGDSKKVVCNMVQDIMLETAKDIKKHVITHSGYCRAEFALIDDKAFSVLTVKQS